MHEALGPADHAGAKTMVWYHFCQNRQAHARPEWTHNAIKEVCLRDWLRRFDKDLGGRWIPYCGKVVVMDEAHHASVPSACSMLFITIIYLFGLSLYIFRSGGPYSRSKLLSTTLLNIIFRSAQLRCCGCVTSTKFIIMLPSFPSACSLLQFAFSAWYIYFVSIQNNRVCAFNI